MARKLTAGQRMIASAREALAFARGESNACVVHIPDQIDTARIRRKIKMSQSRFAAYFGVSVRTVQEWEQGRVVPSGAARAFLIVIDREPDAVRRALVDYAVSGRPEHRAANPK
jgi:putative transcriptional regulator